MNQIHLCSIIISDIHKYVKQIITILVNHFLLPIFITANVRIPRINTRHPTERKRNITVNKPKTESVISELRGSDSIHFSVWNPFFHFFEIMSENNLFGTMTSADFSQFVVTMSAMVSLFPPHL